MNESEYQNLIEILKTTLEFYAREGNWNPENNPSVCAVELKSLVELDGGTQAKFALEKIRNFHINQQDNIEEYIKQVEENLEDTTEIDDLYKTLQEVKKITQNEIKKTK